MKRRSEAAAAQLGGKLQQEEAHQETSAASSSSTAQQLGRPQPHAKLTEQAKKNGVDSHNDITMANAEEKYSNEAATRSSDTSTGTTSVTLARPRLRVHPDPSKPCYMNDLVTVEIQSCMHFLTTCERLKFARTQKKTHSAASSPAAWRHHPPFEMQLQLGWYQGARVRKSLLMHSPAGIQLCGEIEPQMHGMEIEDSDITELLLIPHVKKAVLSAPLLSEVHWRRIMTEWAEMNEVHDLNLTIGQRGLDITAEMYRLKSLTRLKVSFLPANEEDSEDLDTISEHEVKSLHLIPNLTSLTLTDPNLRRSCTYAIEKCTQLTELHLIAPQLRTERFREFFTSPNLSRLERIALTGRWCGGDESIKLPTKSEYIATFSTLSSLRLIALGWSPRATDIMAALVAMKSSRLILRLLLTHSTLKSCVAPIQDFLAQQHHIQVELRGIHRRQLAKYFKSQDMKRMTSRHRSGEGFRDEVGGKDEVDGPEQKEIEEEDDI